MLRLITAGRRDRIATAERIERLSINAHALWGKPGVHTMSIDRRSPSGKLTPAELRRITQPYRDESIDRSRMERLAALRMRGRRRRARHRYRDTRAAPRVVERGWRDHRRPPNIHPALDVHAARQSLRPLCRGRVRRRRVAAECGQRARDRPPMGLVPGSDAGTAQHAFDAAAFRISGSAAAATGARSGRASPRLRAARQSLHRVAVDRHREPPLHRECRQRRQIVGCGARTARRR